MIKITANSLSESESAPIASLKKSEKANTPIKHKPSIAKNNNPVKSVIGLQSL